MSKNVHRTKIKKCLPVGIVVGAFLLRGRHFEVVDLIPRGSVTDWVAGCGVLGVPRSIFEIFARGPSVLLDVER